MNTHKGYLIVSGYHPFSGSEWFHTLWHSNLVKYSKPESVLILASGAWVGELKRRGYWIESPGDLGSCGDLIRHEKFHFINGPSAMWMLGLWYAYMADRDAIYVEQDVLAFGGWLTRLYAEIGPRSCIFGTSKIHGIATSLFLIRHHYIPIFIRDYLMEGPEDHPNRIPEIKIRRMEERNPEEFCRHSMPFDTDRPIDPKRDNFYAQKLTHDELLMLSKEGLIDLDEHWPADVKLFSNRQ